MYNHAQNSSIVKRMTNISRANNFLKLETSWVWYLSKYSNTEDKIICQRNFEGEFSTEPISVVLKIGSQWKS